jgi:hypothetical protein
VEADPEAEAGAQFGAEAGSEAEAGEGGEVCEPPTSCAIVPKKGIRCRHSSPRATGITGTASRSPGPHISSRPVQIHTPIYLDQILPMRRSLRQFRMTLHGIGATHGLHCLHGKTYIMRIR